MPPDLWYQAETGLDNSTLLAPIEGETSDFVIVNHARWDSSLFSVLAKQLGKELPIVGCLATVTRIRLAQCRSSTASLDRRP
jgi:hypothetical protein